MNKLIACIILIFTIAMSIICTIWLTRDDTIVAMTLLSFVLMCLFINILVFIVIFVFNIKDKDNDNK